MNPETVIPSYIIRRAVMLTKNKPEPLKPFENAAWQERQRLLEQFEAGWGPSMEDLKLKQIPVLLLGDVLRLLKKEEITI